MSSLITNTNPIIDNGSVTPEKPYRSRVPFEKRKKEAARIRLKYPARIPVIASTEHSGSSSSSQLLPPLKREKFLVPETYTIGQLLMAIRKEITLSAETAVFMFVSDKHTMMPNSARLKDVYAESHNDDGFLYVTCCGENTFGF